MAIGDISLTSSARANLMSLQNTAKLLGQTQAHLSSGKKVNSALDNATSYFASQGFLNSANDLAGLKDSMATALQTIKAASDAITSIKTVVQQLQGIANSALQTTDDTVRAGLATQYNSLMTQLDDLANDASFNGTNLVNSIASSLKVVFNASNTTYLTVAGQNLRTSGLGIGSAQNSFAVGARAKEVTNSLTVSSVNQSVSGIYSGTLSLTMDTGTAITATGVGAVLTSTSADYAQGAVVTFNSTGANSTLSEAGVSTTYALEAQLGALVSGNTLTITSGSAVTNNGTNALASASMKGAFTVTGGTAATYATATNILTAGNHATNTTATRITIAAGQSVQVTWDDGNGGGGNTVYTNTSANAATIYLSESTTADTAQANATDSSAVYTLSAGAATATGLSLSTAATFGGNQIVDTGGATTGQSLTVKTTSDGTGLTLGTTSQTGVIAYDMTDAVVDESTIAPAEMRGNVTNGGTATYTAAGATITVTGATRLTGSSTTVVADAITTAQNQLTSALATLRTAGSSLGNNNTLVQTRQEFTNSLISTLQTASDNLILADTNEEGANMQALQAQNQLGIVSLSISGQLAQSILKLF